MKPAAILVRAWFASSHPGPTVAVTAVTVVLSIGAGLEPWRVALLGAAMLFDQLSVGLSNDWIDAQRDEAAGRTDKPIATGAISASAVRTSAIVCAVLAVALTVPLGPTAVLVHVIALASAWLYNSWLKNTAFSVVPFAFSFGLLPTLVTVSSTSPAFAAWWALGAGALLGTAAHFANVLPDLEADLVTGIRGLPHRLGVRGSGLVIAIALGAASALLYFGVPGLLQAVGFALGVALAVVSVVLALRGNATRILFRLIMIAAVVDVVMLAASGGSLYSTR